MEEEGFLSAFCFCGWRPLMRQEVDTLPVPYRVVKCIWKIHSLWTEKSKTRVAGHHGEHGAPPRLHIFLILEVRRLPWPHMCRKTLGGQRGVMPRDVLPIRLFCEIHFGWDVRTHMGGSWIHQIWIRTRLIKMIGQNKPGRNSHNSNCQEGVTQGLSWVCPCV